MIHLSLIISTSPAQGHQGPEAFDLAMAGAVFDWQIAVFFVGDGLIHCLRGTFDQIDLSKRWRSSALFGVDQLYRLARQDWPNTALPSSMAERLTAISEQDMQAILVDSRRVIVL